MRRDRRVIPPPTSPTDPSRRAALAGLGSVAALVWLPSRVAVAAPGRPGATASVDEVRDAAAGFGQDATRRSCLVLRDDGWVLVEVDGTERPTTGLGSSTVAAVSADPQGRTSTAVGWSTTPGATGPTDTARMWTSSDGVAWSPVRTATPAGSRLTAVATADDGSVLAVGAVLSMEGHPRLLLSVSVASPSDRTAVPEVGGDLAGYPEALTAAGRGWVAAVVTAQGSTLQASRDGTRWRVLPGGRLSGVAVADLSVVTGGTDDAPLLTVVGNDVAGTQPVLGEYSRGRLTRRQPPVQAPAAARAVASDGSGRRQSAWLTTDRLDVVTT